MTPTGQARPNAATVARVAALLRQMAIEDAEASMRITLAAIRDGMVANGWCRAAAARLAIAFGEAVVSTIRDTSPARVLH